MAEEKECTAHAYRDDKQDQECDEKVDDSLAELGFVVASDKLMESRRHDRRQGQIVRRLMWIGKTRLSWLEVRVALVYWWRWSVADSRLKECPVGLCVMRNEWTVASAC